MITIDQPLNSAVVQVSFLVQNKLLDSDPKQIAFMMNYIYQLEKNKNDYTQ